MKQQIGIGIYGSNGHQVHELIRSSKRGKLVAAAAVPKTWTDSSGTRLCTDLDDLLNQHDVELVSLCSPRRADQAEDAIRCLRAGKHVYAEKPAALNDAELDAILAEASKARREFHEMSETVFNQPFFGLRERIRKGLIGEIVQVIAQKSYPASIGQRPQDEDVDGGLTRQCAIHAVRMVEQIGGVRIRDVRAIETQLGNPLTGGLRMATSFLLTLENGGAGAIVANYLNPPGFVRRGNDQLRLFGTEGMAEITDDGLHSRIVVGERDLGRIDDAPVTGYFERYLDHLSSGAPMPFSEEEEFHPLRVVNRAKLTATSAQD